jgi:hypothetical protein
MGASDGVIHSRISREAARLRAIANKEVFPMLLNVDYETRLPSVRLLSCEAPSGLADKFSRAMVT